MPGCFHLPPGAVAHGRRNGALDSVDVRVSRIISRVSRQRAEHTAQARVGATRPRGGCAEQLGHTRVEEGTEPRSEAAAVVPP
jgi:hypothetical protein